MKTTVRLDLDVELLIRRAMRERGISFKEALNQAVRKGLAREKRTSARRFSQKTFRMGFNPEFRSDKALAIAAALDDEELSRKITARK